jgi:hypothetical protein
MSQWFTMAVMATSRRPASAEAVDEAAAVLRRLLEAVEAGEVEADTPRARVLLRRLEGVLAGWALLGAHDSPPD